MGSEHREHRPLIVGRQVKETVEAKDDVELPVQVQAAHVGSDGLHLWDTGRDLGNHRSRAIHPCNMIAALGVPFGNRLPGTASQIKHPQPRRTIRHGGQQRGFLP